MRGRGRHCRASSRRARARAPHPICLYIRQTQPPSAAPNPRTHPYMRHKHLLLPCWPAASSPPPSPPSRTSRRPRRRPARPSSPSRPTPSDALVDQTIAGLLQRYHYGERTLDDAQSGVIFDQYLEDLDPNKSYFLQSDIDGFAVEQAELDDDIRDGDLQPAFDIFNVFQKRVDQRIQYALKQLDKEPDLTRERELRVRPQQRPLGQGHRRAGRRVAQAREERRHRPVAGGQDLAPGPGDAAQALPELRLSHAPGERRRRVLRCS